MERWLFTVSVVILLAFIMLSAVLHGFGAAMLNETETGRREGRRCKGRKTFVAAEQSTKIFWRVLITYYGNGGRVTWTWRIFWKPAKNRFALEGRMDFYQFVW